MNYFDLLMNYFDTFHTAQVRYIFEKWIVEKLIESVTEFIVLVPSFNYS